MFFKGVSLAHQGFYLFDQKYRKKINIVKSYCSFYYLFPILIYFKVGLGDMAQKIITIIIFISVDIDNYHDKCQIFISLKFKARFLLQCESFTNQTINFP